MLIRCPSVTLAFPSIDLRAIPWKTLLPSRSPAAPRGERHHDQIRPATAVRRQSHHGRHLRSRSGIPYSKDPANRHVMIFGTVSHEFEHVELHSSRPRLIGGEYRSGVPAVILFRRTLAVEKNHYSMSDCGMGGWPEPRGCDGGITWRPWKYNSRSRRKQPAHLVNAQRQRGV